MMEPEYDAMLYFASTQKAQIDVKLYKLNHNF